MAVVVVVGGKAIITNRLKGAGTEPLNIGWGTGAASSVSSDTTLSTETLVDLSTGGGTDHTLGVSSVTSITATNDSYRVVGTRTATGAGTVKCAGLFDAASGGNLFASGNFVGIGLGIGDSIQFTWTVQFL